LVLLSRRVNFEVERKQLTHWLTLNGRLPWVFLPLLLLVVVGLGLRVYGINWDSGFGFHPDERDIYMRSGCMFDLLTEAPGHAQCGYLIDQPEAQPGLPGLGTALDPDRSPLNPHWFPLGSILIYVLVFFRSVIEVFTDIDALDMRYVGRTLSALADVGSVLLVFVLGRRMYSRSVGLLAAAFMVFAVIHIQNSHFYRPETFSVLFTLASFWAMLRMVEKKRLRDSALLGLMVGLALAPKVNILPLVIPLALAYGYRVLDAVDGRWASINSDVVQRILGHAAVAAIVAVAVFFVSAPYAFLDFGSFVSDLTAQTNMARHAGLWPFTVQYIDTAPFVYQIQQSSLWGLGLPLGIIAWLGLLFTGVVALMRRFSLRADLLVLSWVVPTFLLLESFEVRFLRYVFPLMPFLILMGARMLLSLVDWGRSVAGRGAWPANAMAVSGEIPSDSVESLDGFAIGPGPPLPKGGIQGSVSLWRSVVALWNAGPSWSWRPKVTNSALRWNLAWLPVGLAGLILAATVFYALAFERVYAKDHPAVEASRWINENVPRGTAILSDNHWDEFVPDLYSYRVWQFPLYEPDTQEKMGNLASRLADSDYLVFYSNRPYSSVARDPERFPLSSGYYQRLFGGELGYRLERTFTSYPGLAGVEFRDEPLGRAGLPGLSPLAPGKAAPVSFNLGYADDNVVGYDHPRVLLFRNVDGLSEDFLRLLLTRLPAGEPNQKKPNQRELGLMPSPELGLMLSDEDRVIQQSGGTWSKIISRDSWTNSLPVIAWLLVVELAYLAALPLSMFIFRPLPDRGIILARIAGLLGVSYVAWISVSLGWVEFSRSAVVLGFLVIALLSIAVLLTRGKEIKDFLKQHWKLLLIGEVLFLVAFLAFVGVRAANPDLWHPWRGGEKPMELAYFNAVIRSTSLPPFDPWFAGGYLNYYYYGYFVLGGIVRVTGILPTTAFNLGVPLFFALTVTGAYTLVYNLAEGVRRARFAPESGSEPSALSGEAGSGASEPAVDSGPEVGLLRRTLWTPVGAGLMAGLFTAVIGNLDGIVQIAQNTWYKIADGREFPPFDFWRSSRMLDFQENIDPSPLAFWVPDRIPGFADMSSHITEFPFFTFLFADLHAHMMVIPFTLLVIGLGLNLVVGLGSNGRLWIFCSATALALALGALWVINSWDYPAYLLLTIGLIALAVHLKSGPVAPRLALLTVLIVGVVTVSLVAFLPFHQSYEAFNTGLDASKWQTPIDRFLGIHGLFLFIIATFLVYNSRSTLGALARSFLPRFIMGIAPATQTRPREAYLSWLRWVWIAGFVLGVLLAVAGYWTVVLLLVFLLLTGTSLWGVLRERSVDRPFAAVPLALLGMGLTIAIGVDFVRVEGDIGRMNTLFKYYLEVWVLLSLVSAYMLWRLGSQGLFRWRWNWAKGAWLGVLAVLIGSSLIYTALGTRTRLDDRFNAGPATLDGAAFLSEAVHFEQDQPLELKWDQEAIGWLQDHVDGSPVVLEAHAEQYHWSARIASYTGLPTVLGWPWHQLQQRQAYDFEIRDRASHIREMYDTTDLSRAQELLRQYNVKYVVVGELERIYYGQEGLQKFPALADSGLLSRVFQNDGVSIYQVN